MITAAIANAYACATYLALLVALYIDVRNHGVWPAFRVIRIRRLVLLAFFTWSAWLLWPSFVAALPDAIGRDQPASASATSASARASSAQNPGSREHGVCAWHTGSRIAFPDPLRPCTAAASVATQAAPISALRTYPLHAQPAGSPRPAGR